MFTLRFLAFVVAVAAVVRVGGAPVPAPLCAGCNVVLISMDTLRADRLGCYGHAEPTSPNIDRLAERAIVFTNAISQSAWTRPAHTSMFTGLYPSEHGVVAMEGHPAMPTGVATLAGVLAARGYVTAAFTGGANMAAKFGFDQGFATYETHGRRFEDNFDAAAAWLRANAARRFFLFLHGFDSHKPYKSTPEDRRALGLPVARRAGMEAACRRGEREAMGPFLQDYDAAVRRGDRTLGRILGLLEELQVGERTLIVFTSDHGEEFLEHGRCFHIRTLYREVLHVPLLFAVPGLAPRRVDRLVPASVSVAPTLLDSLGVPRRGLPGPSLVAFFDGTGGVVAPVVSETESRARERRGLGHLISYTRQGEKLIDWTTLSRREYFDLVADAAELRPATEGIEVARLATGLERWKVGHPRVAGARTLDALPARLDRRLRALGYLE